MSMMYAAIAGAVVGAASSIMGGRAAAKQADAKRASEIAGAKQNYFSTESSVNIMKAVNREASFNLAGEALRVGAANNQDVRDEVQKAESTLMAQSEGLTSGRSRGRQMISLQMKGNDALQDSKTQTGTVLNKITEEMDTKTNTLNNKLLSAHQQMATILSTPSAVYKQNPMEVVQAGISGAQQGASLASSFSSFSGGGSGGGGSGGTGSAVTGDPSGEGWGYSDYTTV